jgi:hypothetical protein
MAFMYFTSRHRLRKDFKIKDSNMWPKSDTHKLTEPLFKLNSEGEMDVQDVRDLSFYGIRIAQ